MIKTNPTKATSGRKVYVISEFQVTAHYISVGTVRPKQLEAVGHVTSTESRAERNKRVLSYLLAGE